MLIGTLLETILKWAAIGCTIDTVWSTLRMMHNETPGDKLYDELFHRKKK